ncbi:hypothetical protein CEXT_208771 [Caerostris extrusa]|uniref:Uncharacterized protein n=1 Tax=Caerostris extrusa TaxID=172846 RepID=A0AAV4M8W5_CAEEX|nr:hypothetical protein CEXT_208771 [Caerostris extrusa]
MKIRTTKVDGLHEDALITSEIFQLLERRNIWNYLEEEIFGKKKKNLAWEKKIGRAGIQSGLKEYDRRIISIKELR